MDRKGQLLEGYVPMNGLNQEIPNILSIKEINTNNLKIDLSDWAGASIAGEVTGEGYRFLEISCRFGEGEETEFNIFLPSEEYWGGRFFQRAHPFLGLEAIRGDLEFYAENGAYTITVRQGIIGHDKHASAAHVSRAIAKNYYAYDNKIYGYLYGGSGGSMQSIGALELETGTVWDGVIPFITAAPASMGNFDIRWFARAVLDKKAHWIADAVRPGGSGNPYDGLSRMERDILREVTYLGLPLIGWDNYEYLLYKYNYPDLIQGINSVGEISEEYTRNFWNEKGYLESYDPKLQSIFYELKEQGVNEGALAKIAYHRHCDPGDEYQTWKHLRDLKGHSLYSQVKGEHYARAISRMTSGGADWTGKIKHKCIVVSNLKDLDAFPVDGDYYRRRVEAMGLENDFRIWYNENADHHGEHSEFSKDLNHRLINYSGIISQALLDLSAWIEKEVEPPRSTDYEVIDGQVVLNQNVRKRGGIQPGVKLRAEGKDCVTIKTNEFVQLSALIQVPEGTGEICQIEWDLSGTGQFISSDYEKLVDGGWSAKINHNYAEPGVYFPQIRVASVRDSSKDSPFIRALNVGKMRVVVEN